MPRKKKHDELKKWLKDENLFVYKIENEIMKTYYLSNILSDELIAKDAKLKYKGCVVTYIGRINDIYFESPQQKAV